MTIAPYKYIAYIDEAGDPGLKKVKPLHANGSSEWIVISAALIPAELEGQVSSWLTEMYQAIRSPQLVDLHFSKLNHNKKLLTCNILASKRVRLFVIISNKQNMQGYNNPFAAKISSDNWFYCWLTRVLLERLTHNVRLSSEKRYNKPEFVKLEFSERGGLSYGQMKAYYEWINLKSNGGSLPLFLPWGSVDFSVLHREHMKVYNHKVRDGLKLADIVASAFFKAVDKHDTGKCDPSYAKCLKRVMAKEPASKLVSGYGVKLLPNMDTLSRYKVSEEQIDILKFYGYPRQWWQR